MADQLEFNFPKNNKNICCMLWYEKNDCSPLHAIHNACEYFRKKYGSPERVFLPRQWVGNDDSRINPKELEKYVDLIVETDPLILPKHLAVSCNSVKRINHHE